MATAIDAERAEPERSRWTDGSMLHRRSRPDFAFYAKQMRATAVADAALDAVWRVVSAIGGSNGYYFADGLWTLRGYLDRLAGGMGLRRGRRDPKKWLPATRSISGASSKPTPAGD